MDAETNWQADKSVVDDWIKSHWDRLIRVAQSYAGGFVAAEDIVMEALWKAYVRRDRLRDPDAAGDWLETFVRRIGYKSAKKQQGREEAMMKIAPLLEREPPPVPDHLFSIAETKRTIDELPEPMRMVVQMRLEGWPYTDVATRLGMAESTARSYYNRAKRILRSKLG